MAPQRAGTSGGVRGRQACIELGALGPQHGEQQLRVGARVEVLLRVHQHEQFKVDGGVQGVRAGTVTHAALCTVVPAVVAAVGAALLLASERCASDGLEEILALQLSGRHGAVSGNNESPRAELLPTRRSLTTHSAK